MRQKNGKEAKNTKNFGKAVEVTADSPINQQSVAPEGPDIFTYSEYRTFLKDLFASLKKSEKGFSIRKIANKAGISIGYISNIINANQSISDKVFEKLLPHLPLSLAERSYLKLLCTINDSENQVERLDALKRLQKFKTYQKINQRATTVFNYFTRWYCVAIRELAGIEGFQADPAWIQSHLCFHVSQIEIKKALQFLLENDLISKREDGTYQSTEQRIVCEGEAFSIALTQFHKQVFQLATEAIDKIPKEERNIRGHTFSISQENFGKMKGILDEALEKMAQLSSEDKKPDSVYHFSFIGFPMTIKPAMSSEGEGA